MSDEFDKEWDEELDVELSGAFREDPALAGWEFTPAMQQSVMDRIRSAGTDARSPAPARSRPLRWAVPSPVLWATVAAAAFLIVLRVGPGVPSGQKETAAPKASSPAPARDQAEPAKATAESQHAPAMPATRSAKAPEQSNATPEEKQVATAPAQGDAGVAFAATEAPAGTVDAPATGQATLMAVMAPTRIAIAGTDLVLELTPGMVRALGAGQGEVRWERALEGVTPASQVMAVSPDGSRIVILAQTEQSIRLWVLDNQGRPLHTELLTAVPDEVTFVEGNLRLVVNREVQVRVIPPGP